MTPEQTAVARSFLSPEGVVPLSQELSEQKLASANRTAKTLAGDAATSQTLIGPR